MYDPISISNVTADQLGTLARYLERSQIEGFAAHQGGNTGSVKGACFSADYTYDPTSGLLTVNPLELPDPLKNHPTASALGAFQQIVQGGLGASEPSKYGVYDYVVTTIDNQANTLLTYSSNSMTNGTLEIKNDRIASGGGGLEAFEADSTKLSGTGVGGEVIYSLADGQTQLTITFFLNTKFTHSFQVGFTGANNSAYTHSETDTSPTVDGYTYLMPTITIKQA